VYREGRTIIIVVCSSVLGGLLTPIFVNPEKSYLCKSMTVVVHITSKPLVPSSSIFSGSGIPDYFIIICFLGERMGGDFLSHE